MSNTKFFVGMRNYISGGMGLGKRTAWAYAFLNTLPIIFEAICGKSQLVLKSFRSLVNGIEFPAKAAGDVLLDQVEWT